MALNLLVYECKVKDKDDTRFEQEQEEELRDARQHYDLGKRGDNEEDTRSAAEY